MRPNPLNNLIKYPSKTDEIHWMWLGQGSFAYKFGNEQTVVVDPYLSTIVEDQDGLTRIFPHKVLPDEIEGDLVLITHDHLDHYDPDTVPFISRKDIPVIGPHSVRIHYFEQKLNEKHFHETKVGQKHEIGCIRITTMPAHHPSGANYWDSVGYIIEYNGKVIYHVGDSELTPKILEASKGLNPDMLVVPINGRWGNMNAKEAAQLVKETEAKAVIPMHYGLFLENTADPQDFVNEMEAGGNDALIYLPEGFSISTF